MNKNNFTRRNFLKTIFGFSIVPLMGTIKKFFPEISLAKANTDDRVKAFLNLPPDLVMEALNGEEASRMVTMAMENEDSRSLVNSLPSYQPVANEAHATSMSWAKGTHNAIVVSVPFMNPQKLIACLMFVSKDDIIETNLVEFLDSKDLSKAKIHMIKDGKVLTVDPASSSVIGEGVIGPLAGTCTPQLLYQCLGLWGCSGFALATCFAALLLCPFTIISCFAVYVCALYCGGAWSYCFCWACGC